MYQKYCAGHGEILDVLRPFQTKSEYFAFEQRVASPGPKANGTPNRQKSISSDGHSGSSASHDRNSAIVAHVDDKVPLDASLGSTSEFGVISSSNQDTRRSSASLRSRPSFKSLRRSFRKSPASSRHTSRAPSPNSLSETSPYSIAVNAPSATDSSASPNSQIPPVPSIPTSAVIPNPYPLQATTSKPLAFRDLLIKPIQRVCRYPLLLAQFRLPRTTDAADLVFERLENAIKVTRLVAKSVDEAQQLREIAVKSSMIVERLESHSVREFPND